MDCQRKDLDPYAREAYLMLYAGRFVHHTGIAGLRRIAESTNEHEGRDPIIYYDADGKDCRLWTRREEVPYAAEVTVHRLRRKPTTTVVLYDEYAPLMDEYETDPTRPRREQRVKTGRRVPVPMWRPGLQGGKVTVMLGKVGEAASLRAAYSSRMSGWYIPEEMHVAATENGLPLLDDRSARRREAYRIASGGRQDGDIDGAEIGVEVTEQPTDGGLMDEAQVRALLLDEQAAQAAIVGRDVAWMNRKWASTRNLHPADFLTAPIGQIAEHVRRYREYVVAELRRQARHEMADRYAAAPLIGDRVTLFGADPAGPADVAPSGQTAAA
jgi:hypothetical protein